MHIELKMTFDSWDEAREWLVERDDRQIPLPLVAQAAQRPAAVAEAPQPEQDAPAPPAPDEADEPAPLTPAILAELRASTIPQAEWPHIPRSGKAGRMTKADVVAYAKTRAAPAPAEPEPQAEPAPEPMQAELVPSTNPTAATLDQAREALKALNDTLGMPPCIEALKKFGARRVSELDPEQFGEFIVYCDMQRESGRATA